MLLLIIAVTNVCYGQSSTKVIVAKDSTVIYQNKKMNDNEVIRLSDKGEIFTKDYHSRKGGHTSVRLNKKENNGFALGYIRNGNLVTLDEYKKIEDGTAILSYEKNKGVVFSSQTRQYEHLQKKQKNLFAGTVACYATGAVLGVAGCLMLGSEDNRTIGVAMSTVGGVSFFTGFILNLVMWNNQLKINDCIVQMNGMGVKATF